MGKDVTERNAVRNVAIPGKGNSMESDPINSTKHKQGKTKEAVWETKHTN